MIEKCPHCNRDVMFTRNICPNCGHTSSEEARGKKTTFDQERENSKVPTYFHLLESELTAAQRRGLLLLAICSVCLLALDTGIFLVRLHWLSFDAWAILRLAVLAGLLRLLWRGTAWAQKATGLLAGTAGIVGPTAAALWQSRLSATLVFLFCVFGIVLLFVSATLLRSQDLDDYLKLRRKAARSAGKVLG